MKSTEIIAYHEIDESINVLDLDANTLYAIRAYNSKIKTISDLIEYGEELKKIRNIGEKKFQEIASKIKKKCNVSITKDISELEKLSLSPRALNLLVNSRRITTLDELLSLSISSKRHNYLDVNSKTGKEIIDKVHTLGLKFKEEQIKETPITIKDNIKRLEIGNVRFNNLNITIEELLKYSIDEEAENSIYKFRWVGKETAKKIINKVHLLGFVFECEKKENKPTKEIIEIIDKENNIKLTAESSIRELFSTMYQNKSLIPNKMANKGIFTINDLLQLSTNIPNSRQERNIYNIKGLGESRVKELINYLHSLGFIFVDERTNLNNNMTLDYLFNTLDVEYVSREFYEKILTPDDFVDNKFVLIFIKQAEAVCTNWYDNKYTRKEIISFLNNKLLENKKKMLNITNSLVRQLKK